MPDTLTATCLFDTGFGCDTATGIACGEPSSATVSFACIHEHLNRVRICYGCAADVQRADGLLGCPRCWESPVPHDCATLVVIDWDSGEKTIVQEASRG